MFRSPYIQPYMVTKSDVMMSILVYETGSIFECAFLSKVHQVSHQT